MSARICRKSLLHSASVAPRSTGATRNCGSPGFDSPFSSASALSDAASLSLTRWSRFRCRASCSDCLRTRSSSSQIDSLPRPRNHVIRRGSAFVTLGIDPRRRCAARAVLELLFWARWRAPGRPRRRRPLCAAVGGAFTGRRAAVWRRAAALARAARARRAGSPLRQHPVSYAATASANASAFCPTLQGHVLQKRGDSPASYACSLVLQSWFWRKTAVPKARVEGSVAARRPKAGGQGGCRT